MRPRAVWLFAAVLAAAACNGTPSAGPENSNDGPKPPDVASTSDFRYQDVEVVDGHTAFVYGFRPDRPGSVVLRTTDGGAAWVAVLQLPEDSLVGMDFADTTHGAVLTDEGAIFTTEDGGTNWSAPSSEQFARRFGEDAEGAPDFAGLAFVDPKNGFAVGGREELPKSNANAPAAALTVTRPFVVRTTDGGASWKPVALPQDAPASALARVAFADAKNGWTVGGSPDDPDPSGAVLRTTDGGASWQVAKTAVAQTPTDVFFTDASHGWMVGETVDEATNGPGPSQILATTDGGATWQARKPIPTSLRAVRFADPQVGWVVGDRGKIYRTEDGGATWVEQAVRDLDGGQSLKAPAKTGAPEANFAAFALAGPGRAWVVGDGGVWEVAIK